jgi:hypothetical protein
VFAGPWHGEFRKRDVFKTMVAIEGINWPFWWDGSHIEGPIATRWNIRGWPSVYVLDEKGVIRYKGIEDHQLDAAVDTLMKELETAKAGPPVS